MAHLPWPASFSTGAWLVFFFFRTHELADYQAEMAWKSIPARPVHHPARLALRPSRGALAFVELESRFFAPPPEDDAPEVDPSDRGVLPWYGELLLYASMPVFHLHTFLFLSLMLAAWFIVHAPARREILKVVGSALIPASLLVFLVTGFLHGPSVLGWMPGWMQTDPDFLKACREHLGTDQWLVTFPGFLAGQFRSTTGADRSASHEAIAHPRLVWSRAIVFPSLGVFILCCFVKFAPWAWDNTKLMIWSYLAILPILWRRLLSRWTFWATASACAVLFWSGFVSLLGGIDGSHNGYAIASRTELDEVADALRNIPPTARFIANPDYNHPLVLLGRKIALGYTGHVWSHGYEFQEPLARETAILNGDPDWRALALSFDARYLFWGPRERDAHPDSTQAWRTETRLVDSGEWGEIFDLQSPAAPVPPPVFPAE